MTPIEQLEEWRQMAKDCAARSAKMSPWECGFISDIQDRLKQGFQLTSKQAETLDDIWEKVT